MVFLPCALLKEQMALKQVRATVDGKSARSIYFRSQAALEEGTGEPCWAERGYVWFICIVAMLLLFASMYHAFVQSNWVALVVIVVAVFGAVRLEDLALRHLTLVLFTFLFGDIASIIVLDAAWLNFLMSALLAYFLTLAYAARITFLMMMRNDRAYAALYGALRLRFPDKS